MPADEWPEAGPSSLVTRQASLSNTREDWADDRKYAVIVDAGSSGSRLQVYSWKDPAAERAARAKDGKPVKILPTVEKGTFSNDQEWQLKVEPGLSSFGTHPGDLSRYLRPLFDHAKSIIPAQALQGTPVYVLATAGMRLLPEDQRRGVLKETCAFIERDTPFKLPGGCDDHIQVITGEEEGLLGWIAINYLMDGFSFKADDSTGAVDGTKGNSTFGFLDMGGASTQIAFEPSHSAQKELAPIDNSKEELSAVTLRMLDGTDVVHNVFVTTFLGYGTNRARDRYVDALALADKGGARLADPCLPAGLELDAPKTQGAPKKLVGTGSFDGCLELLSPLLEKNAACSRPPCLFHGVHVPTIDFSVNHFIGVSEYWFSSNDVYSLGGAYDFVAFQKAAQGFCGRPWAELDADLKKGNVFGKQVNEDRLEMQCFKSAWMATVLHEGIGLPRIIDSGGTGEGHMHAGDAQNKADEKNLFQSVNDVNGLSVSWTLGKAVLEASRAVKPAPAAPSKGDVGLPASAGVANGIADVPIHADPGIVQYKEQYDWSKEVGEHGDLLAEAQHQVNNHRFFVATFAFFLLLSLLSCCFLRGRSAGAKRRRAALGGVVGKLPFAGLLKRNGAGRGDYTLASMEEGGHDLDVLDGKGARNGNGAQDAMPGPSGSATSTSESSGDERDEEEKRRSRRPINGMMTSLIVPLQRMALTLGIKSADTPLLAGRRVSPRLTHTRRMTNSNRAPMRYSATATPVSLSQPTSPRGASGQSRPASRASLVRSPKTLPGGDAPQYQSLWQLQQLQATTSARNSRAPSPAFGQTTPTLRPDGSTGPPATPSGGSDRGSSYFAMQRHASLTSTGPRSYDHDSPSYATRAPSSYRSGPGTPTPGGQRGFPTSHGSPAEHLGGMSGVFSGNSARLLPQSVGSGFARRAWEDD